MAASLALLGFSISAFGYANHLRSMPAQVAAVSTTQNTSSATPRSATKDFSAQKAAARKHVVTAQSSSNRKYPKLQNTIGTITLPSLHESWPIFEGTGNAELARGVGHYLKSVMPGVSDNAVLAGHRETVFHHLDQLKRGQLIIVATSSGIFTYQIEKFRVVKRSDRTVIVPTPQAVLTLVTCYPINFFGVTHQSFIVSADLVSSRPSSQP